MNLTLLIEARWRLRRPVRVDALETVSDPWRFVDVALVDLGRNLALAVALLPTPDRRAGAVAYLLARALDGLEDMTPPTEDAGLHIREAMAFLELDMLTWHEPVRLVARSQSDRVERVLIRRLALLREALRSLPSASQQRILSTLGRVAEGMIEAQRARRRGALPDLRRYSDQVLGPALGLTFALLKLPAPSGRHISAMARLLQVANNLRDLKEDQGRGVLWFRGSLAAQALRMKLVAGVEAPLMVGLLEPVVGLASARVRGALMLMVLTTTRALSRQAGARAPLMLRLPLLSAALGAMSGLVLRRQLRRLDALLGRMLPDAFGVVPVASSPSSSAPPAAGPRPEAARSMDTVLDLFRREAMALPGLPLSELEPDSPTARRVLLGDYLLMMGFEHAMGLPSEARRAEAEALMEELAAAAGGAA